MGIVSEVGGVQASLMILGSFIAGFINRKLLFSSLISNILESDDFIERNY